MNPAAFGKSDVEQLQRLIRFRLIRTCWTVNTGPGSLVPMEKRIGYAFDASSDKRTDCYFAALMSNRELGPRQPPERGGK